MSTLANNYKKSIDNLSYVLGLQKYEMDSLVEKANNSISFAMLDEYYDNGLYGSVNECKNEKLSYELFATLVGYKMLTKFGLTQEEYEKWAEKQDSIYKSGLYHVIGKDFDDDSDYSTDEPSESPVPESSEAIKKINSFLDDYKYKWITVSDNGEFDFLDKKVSVAKEAAHIVSLIGAVDECSKFALNLFNQDFKEKCTDYESCAANLQSVLADAYSSYWSRYKRALNKLGYQDNIDKLAISYHELSQRNIDLTITLLRLSMSSRINTGESEMRQIYASAREAESRSGFWGGGFGVKGAITGMVAAGILNGLDQGFISAQENFHMGRVKSEMVSSLNDATIGSYAKEEYIKSLTETFNRFTPICISELFNIDFKIPSNLELSKLIEQIGYSASQQSLNDIALKLMESCPLNSATYDFLLLHFTNIKDQILPLAIFFDKGEYVEKHAVNYSIPNSKEIIAISESGDPFFDQKVDAYSKMSPEECTNRLSFIMNFKLLMKMSSFTGTFVNKYLSFCSPKFFAPLGCYENDNYDDSYDGDDFDFTDVLDDEEYEELKSIKKMLTDDVSTYILYESRDQQSCSLLVTDKYLFIRNIDHIYTIPIFEYRLGMHICESTTSKIYYYTILYSGKSINIEYNYDNFDMLLFVLNTITVSLKRVRSFDDYIITQINKDKKYYYYPYSRSIGRTHAEKVWEEDYIILTEKGFVDRYNKYLSAINTRKIPNIFKDEKSLCKKLNLDFEELLGLNSTGFTNEKVDTLAKSTKYNRFIYLTVLRYFLVLGFKKYYPNHLVCKYVLNSTNIKYHFLPASRDSDNTLGVELSDTDYVIYDDGNILITDKYLYFLFSGQPFELSSLIEAIPADEKILIDFCPDFFEGHLGKIILVDKSKDDIFIPLFILNAAIEAADSILNEGKIKQSRSYQYADYVQQNGNNNLAMYCENTGEITFNQVTDTGIINIFSCPLCDDSPHKLFGTKTHFLFKKISSKNKFLVQCRNYLLDVSKKSSLPIIIAYILKNDDEKGGIQLSIFNQIVEKEKAREEQEATDAENNRIMTEEEEKKKEEKLIKTIANNRVKSDTPANTNYTNISRFRKIFRTVCFRKLNNDPLRTDFEKGIPSLLKDTRQSYESRGDALLYLAPYSRYFITDSGLFTKDAAIPHDEIIDVRYFKNAKYESLIYIQTNDSKILIHGRYTYDELYIITGYKLALDIYRGSFDQHNLSEPTYTYYCSECNYYEDKKDNTIDKCPNCKKAKKKVDLWFIENKTQQEIIEELIDLFKENTNTDITKEFDASWQKTIQMLYEKSDYKKCSDCGNVLPKEAAFCTNCGHKFTLVE